MMPSEKIAQFSSAPPLNKLKSAATLPPGFSRQRACGTTPASRAWLTPGRGDRRAQTHDHDDRERKQNPPPQLRNLDRDLRNAETIA